MFAPHQAIELKWELTPAKKLGRAFFKLLLVHLSQLVLADLPAGGGWSKLGLDLRRLF